MSLRVRLVAAVVVAAAVSRAALARDSTGCLMVTRSAGVRLPNRLSLYAFLPVPVYRYVNEDQLAPRLSLLIGVARTFR